jgi:hypothetical protein
MFLRFLQKYTEKNRKKTGFTVILAMSRLAVYIF